MADKRYGIELSDNTLKEIKKLSIDLGRNMSQTLGFLLEIALLEYDPARHDPDDFEVKATPTASAPKSSLSPQTSDAIQQLKASGFAEVRDDWKPMPLE